MLIEDVPEQCSRRLPGCMRVDHVDAGLWNLEIPQVGSEHGIQLPRHHLETRLREQTVKFIEHHRVRREQTDSQMRLRRVSGHCSSEIQASEIALVEQGTRRACFLM